MKRPALGGCLLFALLCCTLVNAACDSTTPSATSDNADRSIPDVALHFRRNGRDVRSFKLSELAQHAPVQVVRSQDPYYHALKQFRALSLESVLSYAFGLDLAALRRQFFVLKAKDGYAVPIEGARLLEQGAYLAFDDVDVPGFAPIGPQKVSPAPTYLVWTKPGQDNLDTHPRPWQLATIEIASFETLYPHTVPPQGTNDSPAQHGFAVFRDHCIKCHAINREGGRVGPDLNVPQSIVEYRPEPQIRAYIQDPGTFRYGAMPPHPTLTAQDLDGLIAYFHAMAARKHDPDKRPPIKVGP